jgi:hypothetical protein
MKHLMVGLLALALAACGGWGGDDEEDKACRFIIGSGNVIIHDDGTWEEIEPACIGEADE